MSLNFDFALCDKGQAIVSPVAKRGFTLLNYQLKIATGKSLKDKILLAAPSLIASLGMPNTAHDASSCAIV